MVDGMSPRGRDRRYEKVKTDGPDRLGGIGVGIGGEEEEEGEEGNEGGRRRKRRVRGCLPHRWVTPSLHHR